MCVTCVHPKKGWTWPSLFLLGAFWQKKQKRRKAKENDKSTKIRTLEMGRKPEPEGTKPLLQFIPAPFQKMQSGCLNLSSFHPPLYFPVNILYIVRSGEKETGKLS